MLKRAPGQQWPCQLYSPDDAYLPTYILYFPFTLTAQLVVDEFVDIFFDALLQYLPVLGYLLSLFNSSTVGVPGSASILKIVRRRWSARLAAVGRFSVKPIAPVV